MEAGWLTQCRMLIAGAGLLSLREMCAADARFVDRLQSWSSRKAIGCMCFTRIAPDLRQVCRVKEHQVRDLNEIELAYRLHD
jgi:hypothetical protein